jgi:DNA-binding NtrC family response regulator
VCNSQPFKTKRIRILHIDPSILVLRLIRETLTEFSYFDAEIIGFSDPKEAARYLLDYPKVHFDLFIIDAAATGDLGETGIIGPLLDTRPNCPVIATRYADAPNYWMRAELLNVHPLTKPFRTDQLLALIEMVCECHDAT